MFNDLVEIMTFMLEQIKEKKIKQNHCEAIYYLYRHLDKLYKKMNHVITFLSRDIADYDKSLDVTPTNKWVDLVNGELNNYGHLKYGLYSMILQLEDNFTSNDSILSSNFSNMLLNCSNCEGDLFKDIAYVDDELQLHIYRFNLITNNPPKYRDYRELFTEIMTDIDSDEKRLSVIDSAKRDEKEIEKLLTKFEGLLQERCGISDLFVERKKIAYEFVDWY